MLFGFRKREKKITFCLFSCTLLFFGNNEFEQWLIRSQNYVDSSRKKPFISQNKILLIKQSEKRQNKKPMVLNPVIALSSDVM